MLPLIFFSVVIKLAEFTNINKSAVEKERDGESVCGKMDDEFKNNKKNVEVGGVHTYTRIWIFVC